MPKKLSQQINPASDTLGASLNAVMRHGGVTLQNILWRPVTGQQSSESEFSTDACSLPLTLDLLHDKSLGEISLKLISETLPPYVQPIVVYGATPLSAPALEVETLTEIILAGNSVGIEPQIHTIRVKAKHQHHASAVTSNNFDTILFCSGLAIGDKPVIIGAAFLGEDDRGDLVREAVRQTLRQLCADQIALTDIMPRCLELPRLARVLIDADDGGIIWRNRSAIDNWGRHSSSIKYLAQLRGRTGVSSDLIHRRDESYRLTLVTFLRSESSQERMPCQTMSSEITSSETMPSETISPLAKNFEVGDEVRFRLNRVIGVALPESNDPPECDSRKVDSKRAASNTEVLSSISVDVPDNEQVYFEEARRALEIALRHLPEGGRLKLSPINNMGLVRMRSFDKDGEETVDITLKERTFVDNDDFL